MNSNPQRLNRFGCIALYADASDLTLNDFYFPSGKVLIPDIYRQHGVARRDTINVDKFNLPIFLSYNTMGIKPNIHASWVGTGWSLVSGGVITRKQNGLIDEYIDLFLSQDGDPGTKLGWYYHPDILNVSDPNWASFDNLIDYPESGVYKGSWRRDAAPDEFVFNVNGHSGSFYLGNDGLWKIKSKDASSLKVEETVGCYKFKSSVLSYRNETELSNIFTQFILTFNDGIKFVFGGDPNSIEFNRTERNIGGNRNVVASSWFLKSIILPSGKKIDFEYFRNGNEYLYNPIATASKWAVADYPVPDLTSSYYKWVPYIVDRSHATGVSTVMEDVSFNIVDPVHLKSITFPTGKLKFNSSKSNEEDILEDPYNDFSSMLPGQVHSPNHELFYHIVNSFYNDLMPSDADMVGRIRPPSTWFKLDDIELLDLNENKIKKVNFTYTQDVNGRFFLQQVQMTGLFKNQTGISMPAYVFSYNQTLLPKYCSRHIDHWGFYNGPESVNPYPTEQFDESGFPTTNFLTSYDQFRNPNASYIQAGMLKKITYPTGGYTEYEYEQNTYSNQVQGFPPVITPVSGNPVGPGLRIKNIKNFDVETNKGHTYSYKYNTSFSSNVSSGVMGMPKPVYLEIGNLRATNPGTTLIGTSYTEYLMHVYNNWTNIPIYTSYNDDSYQVSYSTVIEMETDGGNYNGYRIVTFSNHDNGYINKPPVSSFWTHKTDYQLAHFNDMSLERGNILWEEIWTNNNKRIKRTDYLYNDDPSRFDNNIKQIKATGRFEIISSNGGGEFPQGPIYIVNQFRSTATLIYTYFPFLKKTTETVYDPINNTEVVTSQEFTYDQNYRLLKEAKTSNSKKLEEKTQYTYATDYPAISLYNQMKDKHFISPAVEIKNLTGSTLLSTMTNTYYSPNPGIYALKETSTKQETNNVETRVTFDNYDIKGNLLTYSKKTDIKTSYQWGHNYIFPLAAIKNAATFDQTYSEDTYSTTLAIPTNANQATVGFTTYDGTITLSLDAHPGKTYELEYSIVGEVYTTGILCTGIPTIGQVIKSGTLCVSSSSVACQSNHYSSVTFNNIPAGNYTLYLFYYGSDPNVYRRVSYTYPRRQVATPAYAEFFYNGFEDDPNAQTTNPLVGERYFEGDYTVPFSAPNSRTYKINYRYRENGSWKYITKNFTNNMTLTEGDCIDEVRVYPEDARMTTYTYNPGVGMTSETDPNGKTTFYEYDSFGKLKLIRDQDFNIIKIFDYKYQQEFDLRSKD